MSTVQIFDNKKKQTLTVGNIENNCYIKKVIRSKHYLRNFGGYAIQAEILEALKDSPVKQIVFLEDNGNEFRIDVSSFIAHGFPIDFAHGKQIVINEKFFTKKDSRQLTFGD